MFASVLFLIVLAIGSNAELTVNEGFNGSISFAGDELHFHVDNPRNKDGSFTICFASTSNVASDDCSTGFVSFSDGVIKNTGKNYTLNRQENSIGNNIAFINSDLRFNPDGSIDVFIAELPKKMSLVFINGKEVVAKSNTTEIVIGIVGGGIGIVVIMSVVAFLVYWFILRKRAVKPTPTTIADDQVPPTIEEQQPFIERKPKSVMVPPKRQPSQESTTPATKETSTTTTKPSNENVEAPRQPPAKNVPIPKPLVIQVIHEDLPGPSAEPSSPILVTAKSSKKSKRSKSRKQRSKAQPKPKPSTTSTPPPKATSPLLPVDKTQSVTQRSPTQKTLPTPEFGNDPTANTLADQSAYNPRQYVPAAEAPLPGQPIPRPKKVADEVDDIKGKTEVFINFAQRRKEISGHDLMKVTDRMDFTKRHDLSDAERRLLKATAKDAPRLADIVLKEAEEAIARHADFGGEFDEGKPFWTWVNDQKTPASVGLVLLYRLVPDTFKLTKMSLSDPKVRAMPLSGLYILLLDRKLPHAFRVELAGELRKRASKVVPYVQRDLLKKAAFPAHYLMRAYLKNNESFISGSEVHSKSSHLSA